MGPQLRFVIFGQRPVDDRVEEQAALPGSPSSHSR
jgi:hypothetical protein